MPVVLVGALLARLVLLPFPPLLSDDAYRYLWDGLVMHIGDSPYRFLPSRTIKILPDPDDPPSPCTHATT